MGTWVSNWKKYCRSDESKIYDKHKLEWCIRKDGGLHDAQMFLSISFVIDSNLIRNDFVGSLTVI